MSLMMRVECQTAGKPIHLYTLFLHGFHRHRTRGKPTLKSIIIRRERCHCAAAPACSSCTENPGMSCVSTCIFHKWKLQLGEESHRYSSLELWTGLVARQVIEAGVMSKLVSLCGCPRGHIHTRTGTRCCKLGEYLFAYIYVCVGSAAISTRSAYSMLDL